MLNIAIEGKFLIGACAASIVAASSALGPGNVLRRACLGARSPAGAASSALLLAWLGIR